MKEGKNIWQRKDGRWEARYIRTYDGRRAVYGSVYAATYEDARKKQQAAQPGGTGLDKTDIFSMSAAFLKQKQYAVKESTLALYENTIRNRILPYWKDGRLCDISKQRINGFYTDLFAKGLSPKSVKDTLTLLRGILSYAHGNGMLPDVPAFPSIHSIRFCADILSEKEQKTLTAYLTQNPDFGKIGVLLSLMTGMRIGEICALQKGDMDFSDGHICVRRTLQRLHAPSADGRKTKLMTDSPKSASSERKIPLPARLCAWLYPLYAGLTDDSYILTGTPTPTEPRSYYRVYQRHLAACGCRTIPSMRFGTPLPPRLSAAVWTSKACRKFSVTPASKSHWNGTSIRRKSKRRPPWKPSFAVSRCRRVCSQNLRKPLLRRPIRPNIAKDETL